MRLAVNNFDENGLSVAAIKLTIEDWLPWAKVELAFANTDDDRSAHRLTRQVRVCIVLAGAIVVVAVHGAI